MLYTNYPVYARCSYTGSNLKKWPSFHRWAFSRCLLNSNYVENISIKFTSRSLKTHWPIFWTPSPLLVSFSLHRFGRFRLFLFSVFAHFLTFKKLWAVHNEVQIDIWVRSLKDSHSMGDGRIFLKNFGASLLLFNDDLLNEPNFRQIHLAGQCL